MTIAEYKSGDKVEILINNPRNDNKDEWRPAEVIDKRTIYPREKGGRPYPILIVRVLRTYCTASPEYKWIDSNIPVFVSNKLEFYDRVNDEGVLYEGQIRLKS
jgi:hypothetical protein